MPFPPFDRPIALACTMHTLRERWLYVRCECGASQPRPVRLMLRERPRLVGMTLADVVVRIRCHLCAARPASVYLVESGISLPGVPKSAGGGWRLLLHGEEESPNDEGAAVGFPTAAPVGRQSSAS